MTEDPRLLILDLLILRRERLRFDRQRSSNDETGPLSADTNEYLEGEHIYVQCNIRRGVEEDDPTLVAAASP